MSLTCLDQAEMPCTSGVHLSMPPDKSDIISLATDYILSLWNKAKGLLNTTNGVCNAPGMENTKCVASESGGRPGLVSRSMKGLLQCDQDCLGWKAQRICSHVLAAAESMGSLAEFLKCYNGKRTIPNLTAAVTHGLSKAALKIHVSLSAKAMVTPHVDLK